MLQYETIRV